MTTETAGGGTTEEEAAGAPLGAIIGGAVAESAWTALTLGTHKSRGVHTQVYFGGLGGTESMVTLAVNLLAVDSVS